MEIRELIDKLNHYTELYDKGVSPISDAEWDKMYFTLQQQEKETGIIYPDSPTQSIHFETVSKLNKINHEHSMLSLDKTKDISEVASFLHGKPFVAMFKMDGLTCSLTYDNGELVRAETRGNGIVGEDILHNALVVKNIPTKIPYFHRLVVDGEIICRKDDFEQFKEEYKNPRNFSAGSIRLLSSKECAKRNLSFVAWEMIEGYDAIKHFFSRLSCLEMIGFDTVPCVHSESVEEALDSLEHNFKREHEIYPKDGYVFKFNDVEYGKRQGQTEHHLKNAIAYKLYDDLYDTRLKTIHWTMGRTGVLTPVAVFDPIDIDGSTVERASLHNVSVMRATLGNCAYVGEPLKIFKANQIIPQVAEAGPKYDYGYVIAHAGVSANDNPEFCPICGGAVEYIKSEDGVINAYCSNPLCDGKLINRLEHFCGKKGLDIKGLSKATFQKLIDWGWVKKIEDIFALDAFKAEWIKKPGFGVASVNKVLTSIEEHKTTTLAAFISAIGIPLIGQTAAKDLAKQFSTYEEFRASIDDANYHFSTLDNFGDEMDYSLKNFNYEEADRIAKIIKFQTSAPLKIKSVSLANISENQINNILAGKTVVITGKLTTVKNRAELTTVIEEHGGKVASSISGKTDILINNDVNSTSAKNKAAKERNIPIVSELDFMKQYIEN